MRIVARTGFARHDFFNAQTPRQHRGPDQKKRRQQCRHRNTDSKTPTLFSKKKPPYPTKSGAAVMTDQNDLVVYWAFSWVVPFCSCGLFCFLLCRPLSSLSTRLAEFCEIISIGFFLIPSSARRLFDIRLRAFRKSCALFSGRSFRSSTGKDFLPVRTSDPVRSVVRGDLR